MHVALNGSLLSGHFSGVEVAILNLAQALGRYGRHRYTLFAPARCFPPLPASDRLVTRAARIPTHHRAMRILWEQAVLPRRVVGLGCDVLHAPGYIAPLRTPVPTVISVYDIIALKFPAWCHAANRWHFGFMLPRSIRRATRIIVPSEATRRDIEARFPGSAGRIRVIPLAVGEEFAPVRDETHRQRVRARYELPARYLLFVGNTEPKKNLVRLLEGYHALLHDVAATPPLVIAGCDAWGHDEVVAGIRKRGLDEKVHVIGYVAQEDLPCLYGMAELCAFPSLYEGFGLPPLEAMACGVPVMTSDRGALPEVTGDAALVVDPEDAVSIAEGLRRLLQDDALKHTLVERGRERVMRFTWRDTAERTEAVYDSLLAPSREV